MVGRGRAWPGTGARVRFLSLRPACVHTDGWHVPRERDLRTGTDQSRAWRELDACACPVVPPVVVVAWENTVGGPDVLDGTNVTGAAMERGARPSTDSAPPPSQDTSYKTRARARRAREKRRVSACSGTPSVHRRRLGCCCCLSERVRWMTLGHGSSTKSIPEANPRLNGL